MPDLILNGQTAGKNMNLIPLVSLTSQDLKTSLLNILLLVPFGFGLPFITNLRMKKIVVIGALFSIVIEFLQLVTGFMAKITFRIADINDVIFNTVGVVIGYILFVGFVRIYRHISHNGGERNRLGTYRQSKKGICFVKRPKMSRAVAHKRIEPTCDMGYTGTQAKKRKVGSGDEV
jgi:hypothetical protein